MEKIRVAGLVNDSITDGPGIRFTIFVQGCPHNCKGCHNPQTHDFDAGKLYDDEEIFTQIKNNPLLTGVTFSGGEPMCQADKLLPLAKKIKELGLELAIYSGFLYENLIQKNDSIKNLLNIADVLIDGPFVESLRDYSLKFKGSSNQRVIDLKRSISSNELVIITDDRWN
ncbi:MAG: anaerobic ribonucleoside-triphosphate reductase activating protein [Clostridia bacterium]|nr:anaerobic ribonucleoside-triphosphate reductase activating protein [Clostridia bacterium]